MSPSGPDADIGLQQHVPTACSVLTHSMPSSCRRSSCRRRVRTPPLLCISACPTTPRPTLPVPPGRYRRCTPYGVQSLAASLIQTSSTAASEEEQTEELEDEGQGGKGEEGDEEEEEEEEEEVVVVWLLGRAHDGPRTREREGSEWSLDF